MKLLLIALIVIGGIVYFLFRKKGEELAHASVPKPSGLQKAVAVASVAIATIGKGVAVVTDAIALVGGGAASGAVAASGTTAATAAIGTSTLAGTNISIAAGTAAVPGGGTTAISGAASGIGVTAVSIAAPLFLFSIPILFPRLFGFRPETKAQYEARLAVWVARGGAVISPGYVPLGVHRPKEVET